MHVWLRASDPSSYEIIRGRLYTHIQVYAHTKPESVCLMPQRPVGESSSHPRPPLRRRIRDSETLCLSFGKISCRNVFSYCDVYGGTSSPTLSLADVCFEHGLKCYDDVLAELKRAFQCASRTADSFFKQKGSPGFMLWLGFCSPAPRAFVCLIGCQSKLWKYDAQNPRR